MNSDTQRKRRPWWLSFNMLGILLLISVLGGSLYRVLAIHRELFDPDETIIRIAHWQLELGYRDAMDDVIRMYEQEQAAKGKKVRILQMAVTEKVYPQWLNTSLISGEGPDLALTDQSTMVNNEQYLVRYFVPLSQILSKPNPYNKGNELENVPWRETFFDGMRAAYNLRLQDYYKVPTAAYNLRVFYNKNMFREATGSDKPPETFGELMDVCRKIREYGQGHGRALLPIAGSSYGAGMILNAYLTMFTAGLEKDLDLDLDGAVTQQEIYIGFLKGKVNFAQPNVRAFFDFSSELCSQFNKGFYGRDRATAAFDFVQQRAAMICSGSWDAQSLFVQGEQAGFDVGIFDFPVPAPNETYGRYVAGKVSEAASGAQGGFGLYKLSRHPEQALDFLQFLTSKRINQIHMEKANWIPVVLGTQPTGRMAPFASDPVGFVTYIDLWYGSAVDSIYLGEEQSYLQGEESYDKFARTVEDALRNPHYGGDRAWTLEEDDLIKQIRNQERVLAVQVIRQTMLGAADAPEKFQQVLLQQVRLNDGETMRYRFKEVRGFDLPSK